MRLALKAMEAWLRKARFAIDDAPCFVSDLPNKNIIALIAPSAQGNFDLPKLITALKTLGVNWSMMCLWCRDHHKILL